MARYQSTIERSSRAALRRLILTTGSSHRPGKRRLHGLHVPNRLKRDLPRGIDENVGRIPRHMESIRNLLRIRNDGVVKRKLFQEIAHLRFSVQSKGQEHDTRILRYELVQDWDLFPTGKTTDEPEIQRHDLPLQLLKRPMLSVYGHCFERERPLRL